MNLHTGSFTLSWEGEALDRKVTGIRMAKLFLFGLGWVGMLYAQLGDQVHLDLYGHLSGSCSFEFSGDSRAVRNQIHWAYLTTWRMDKGTCEKRARR